MIRSMATLATQSHGNILQHSVKLLLTFSKEEKMRTTKLLSVFTAVLSILIFLSSSSYSDPLDNWHWRNPLPQGNTLQGVTYGNGTFVAVGENGTILTSPDGVF